MSEVYTILTPLPQLGLEKPITWPEVKRNPLLDEGLWFTPMTPPLYRSLVNLAKEQDCSDNIIMLLQEAKTVFLAEVPQPMPASSTLSGAYYGAVGDAILRRLFDCLLLFEYVPKPFRRSFWYVASGPPEKIDMHTLRLLDPGWDWYEFEIKYSKTTTADQIIFGLQMFWDRISPIFAIDKLKTTFTDPRKQKGYVAAGNANVERGGEKQVISLAEERGEPVNINVRGKQASTLFFDGYNAAYFNEIGKLDRRLYKQPSGQRFIRAFQFFTNACRLENPHRFAALISSLETLFCTSSSAITFQLASRMAWFLSPDDLNKRKEIFDDIKELYNIRSKIVHGGKYSISKVEDAVDDLENTVRSVFWEILMQKKVYGLFFNKDQKLCDDYLDGLNLGQANQEKTEGTRK